MARPTTVEEMAMRLGRRLYPFLHRATVSQVCAGLRAAGLTDAMLGGWRPAGEPPGKGEEVIAATGGQVDKEPHVYSDGAWYYWCDRDGWLPLDADEEPDHWHPYPAPPEPIKSVPWGTGKEAGDG